MPNALRVLINFADAMEGQLVHLAFRIHQFTRDRIGPRLPEFHRRCGGELGLERKQFWLTAMDPPDEKAHTS